MILNITVAIYRLIRLFCALLESCIELLILFFIKRFQRIGGTVRLIPVFVKSNICICGVLVHFHSFPGRNRDLLFIFPVCQYIISFTVLLKLWFFRHILFQIFLS